MACWVGRMWRRLSGLRIGPTTSTGPASSCARARGPPPGFRSACGAGGVDEKGLEPAENWLAVVLQLAEAFGPVERELGGTHALEDLAIAV
jgi:hypothetical protein